MTLPPTISEVAQVQVWQGLAARGAAVAERDGVGDALEVEEQPGGNGASRDRDAVQSRPRRPRQRGPRSR